MPASRHYRILTYNHIASVGLRRFPAERYRVGDDLERPDAILVRSKDLRHGSVASSVRAIARAGVGTDNLPVAEMSRRGIPVFNTPGANANAVKELVFAALFLAARNIVPALRHVESLAPEAGDLERRVEEGKHHFAGVELTGRTLGIIGLGAIGSIVADTAIKLGMKVVGFDPEITVDAAWRLPSSVRKASRSRQSGISSVSRARAPAPGSQTSRSSWETSTNNRSGAKAVTIRSSAS